MNVVTSPHHLGLRRRLFLAIKNMDVTSASLVFDQGLDADTRFNLNSSEIPAISISAEHNDLPMVRLMITLGASVNQKGSGGRTPLSTACYFGFTELATLLVKNGADANARDNDGCTPLLQACKKGHSELAMLVLDTGADVNAPNKLQQTPLLAASTHGDLNVVESLVQRGAYLGCTDVHGRNCLHYAATATVPNVSIVKFLCQRIPSAILQMNALGDSPLHCMVCNQDRGTECLKVMLSLAPIEITKAPQILSVRGNVGHTYLHTAASFGYIEGVRLFLAAGADVNACDTYGCTPLECSIRSGRNIRLTKLLLEAGAKIPLRRINRYHANDDTGSFVKNIIRNPLSLRTLCRNYLAMLYGPCMERIGESTPLPRTLRKYLRFEC